jgi:hypothetical protein
MAQALKEAKAVTTAVDSKLSKVKAKKSHVKNAPEATILNFDKTKSFSRFLEASCDCC